MKAVRVHEFGGPQVLKVETDVPIPAITDTQVIYLQAFFSFLLFFF
jgi:NADPH:quinone reductase